MVVGGCLVVVVVVVVVVANRAVVVGAREVEVVVEACSTVDVVGFALPEAHPDNASIPPIRRAAKQLLRPNAI